MPVLSSSGKLKTWKVRKFGKEGGKGRAVCEAGAIYIHTYIMEIDDGEKYQSETRRPL
jgi:hypothetical protein